MYVFLNIANFEISSLIDRNGETTGTGWRMKRVF